MSGQYDWLYIGLALLLLASILLKVFDAKIKGAYGEWLVKVKLKGLDKNKYIVINDVYLSSASGNTKTTQVDHIVVSTYGLFVIETKNYGGTILGSDNGTQWTQYFGRKKYKMYNPLRQNYGHVKSLEKWLDSQGIDGVPVVPLVVFTGDAKLKGVSKNKVVSVGRLNKVIKENSETGVLSEEKVLEIANKLRKDGIPEAGEAKSHVKEIKQIKKNRNAKTAKGVCPECGGALILRYSKKKNNSFYGCSNFPKCRYTVEVDEVKESK